MRFRPKLAYHVSISSKPVPIGEGNTAEFWVWVLVCLAILLAPILFPGCGPVKAVETSLRIDADRCKEAGVRPADPDSTFLDCVSGGELTVRIEMPRRAWQDMKLRKAGIFPDPPGK